MKADIYKNYPRLKELGVPIHEEQGVKHILGEDLNKVLSKKRRKQFSNLFGAQTCLLRKDNKVGIYPYDAEAVLERMFSGKLTKTQLYWD